MAQSKSTKKLFNMAYGLGASVVIIGALFKILHWEIGPLTGGLLLAVGLITEALIFAISAFEPVDDELDWALVYPELAGGATSLGKTNEAAEMKEAEASLSATLDNLYKVQLESASKQATVNEEQLQNASALKDQMQSLATNLSSLNGVYGGMLTAMNRN